MEHLEASAWPADLQEQDTCHRYLNLSCSLSLRAKVLAQGEGFCQDP